MAWLRKMQKRLPQDKNFFLYSWTTSSLLHFKLEHFERDLKVNMIFTHVFVLALPTFLKNSCSWFVPKWTEKYVWSTCFYQKYKLLATISLRKISLQPSLNESSTSIHGSFAILRVANFQNIKISKESKITQVFVKEILKLWWIPW